ncbi:MAG: Phosphatidylglycerophosphatase [Planctomycetota bacterium]|jgi:phosphatidylglycerophosphatase A
MSSDPVAPSSSSRAEPGRGAGRFDPAAILATCGGLGWLGPAPGTLGAAAGVIAAAAVARLGLPPLAEAAAVVVANLVGIPACTRAARLIGRGHDPGAIVYDEAASVMLVLLAVPAAARSPAVLVAAFALHRLFDITKPFPCRRLERLPAGLGIMSDDWAAAAYAAMCLAAGRWLGWL